MAARYKEHTDKVPVMHASYMQDEQVTRHRYGDYE